MSRPTFGGSKKERGSDIPQAQFPALARRVRSVCDRRYEDAWNKKPSRGYVDWDEWLQLEVGRRTIVRASIKIDVRCERDLDHVGEGVPGHLLQILL